MKTPRDTRSGFSGILAASIAVFLGRLFRGSLLVLALMAQTPDSAQARPERIVPGDSYYSHEFSVQGGIAELGAQRNFEEVYQLYTYYEGVYDERQRMSRFRVYERGQILWEERYFYQPDGYPSHKERIDAGQAPKRMALPGS